MTSVEIWRVDKPSCGVCSGRGFYRNPLANRDGFWACLKCGGRVEAGALVVQLVGRLPGGGEVFDELTRQWESFGKAGRFARGLAITREGKRLRLPGGPGGPPRVSAVRVVYKSAGPDVEVLRVPVDAPAEAPAAALTPSGAAA